MSVKKSVRKKQKELPPVYLGQCMVDSGQLIVADPCYLKQFNNNGYSEDPKHRGTFSYAGCAQASLSKKSGGTLGDGLGVAFKTMWGDGTYDVLGMRNDDGKIDAIVIPLDIYPDLKP